MTRSLDARLLAALLLALTGYRLWMIALAPYTLAVDEAQYWSWAQDLAAGYFSKPPMIAWAIAGATALLGDTVFAVRCVAALLYAATALVIVALGRELGAGDAATWAGLAFATLPGVSHYARAMTVDGWLLLFWALALLGLLRALRTDRWSDWLLAGAAAGLGLMSKYTMGAFGVLAAAWLLASPRYRTLLRSVRPWSAALLALAIFAPNIVWNARHGFPTLRHTAEISGLGAAALDPAEALGFVAGQWIYMGPLLGLLGFAAWWRWLRGGAAAATDNGPSAVGAGPQRDPREVALLWFSLPLVVFVALMGLVGRALANWAAPAMLAWCLLTVIWLVRGRRQGLLLGAIALNLVLLLPVHHFDAVVRLVGLELDARSDPYKRVRGWDRFGAAVRERLAATPDALLLVDTRELAAQAAFYVPLSMDRIRVWNPDGAVDNHYQLVASLRAPDDRRYLYLGRCLHPQRLRGVFDEYQRLDGIRVPIHHDYAIRVRVALVAGPARSVADRPGQPTQGELHERHPEDSADASGHGTGPGQARDACLFR